MEPIFWIGYLAGFISGIIVVWGLVELKFQKRAIPTKESNIPDNGEGEGPPYFRRKGDRVHHPPNQP